MENHKIKLSEQITFHFISIDSYPPKLKNYIEENIHKIWNGDNEVIESSNDIRITKTEIKNLLENKTDLQKNGIVSEFFCHLYLRAKNFNQHFLFSNLEEKGMKKGFDGLYGINNEFYIYESKSSLETTHDATHNSNISEAYNDLKKKIEGLNTTNNPWKNAYNHATLRSVNFNDTISKTLKKLSKEYVDKKFEKIDKYNIIPSSTIFLGARYNVIDKKDLIIKMDNLTKNYSCKHLDVLCLNKNTIQNFIDYLDE
ncbi:hypothetical protein [Chryseobacterium vaccae]|uniref:hypothetical protein n=1 Tax=Chryseobacterium vaccae TaxID=2604424 RepID=UPI001296EE13|nr:hypothetical protein [Chryseobacterium vaccae]